MKTETAYKVNLSVNNTELKAEGETAVEAIENIPVTWKEIKTKGVFTLTKDKLKAEKLFYLRPLRMLFANKTRMALQARYLEQLLN